MDTKKKRTIYIAILVSLTVLISTVAIAYRIGAFGKKLAKMTTQSGSYSGESISKSIVFDEAFSAIDIDAEVGEFTIETGEGYSLNYDFPNAVEPIISNHDGKLVVEVKGKSGINNSFFNIGMPKFELAITVPESAELNDISIQVNAGSVEMTGFSSDSITLDLDAGSVTIREMKANSFDATTAAGSVDVRDSVLGDCTIETDAGSIDLRNCQAGACDMVTNMGSIDLKKCDIKDGDFTIDLGSLSFNGGFNSISAQCSLGSIDVKSDNIEGKKMKLETDLGSVVVNGSDKGSSFLQ